MRTNTAISAENVEVLVARPCPEVLGSAPVDVSQLLGAALDALFRSRERTATEASEATGIDGATISKFRTGRRWPNADAFDALAAFFQVEPYVLLKPDAAFVGVGNPTGQGMDRPEPHTLESASPYDSGVTKGAAVSESPLFRKLLGYWQAMEPEQRAELVGIAYGLASPTPHEGRAPKVRA